ncbi:hypothetical protein U9M48_009775, partial [Paspalum notatum var. saurae]
ALSRRPLRLSRPPHSGATATAATDDDSKNSITCQKNPRASPRLHGAAYIYIGSSSVVGGRASHGDSSSGRGGRRAGQGVPWRAHPLRPPHLRRRRHRRPHRRLRHRHIGRRDIHGHVPAQVLPVGVPQGAGGGAGRRHPQPVLQVRQPAADRLHVVALPGGARRLLLRGGRGALARAEVVHVRRWRLLPRRRRAQRRRAGRRHAHRRAHSSWRRRRLRWPVHPNLPVGDGAPPPPRHAEHRPAADDHRRHLLRQPRQLRRGQDPGRLGLAPQPRPRRRPGGRNHRGLALPPRHAQLPHRPRQPRAGAAGARADPRHRRRRRRVRRPRAGRGFRRRRHTAVDRHPPAQAPAAARHGRARPVLPAAHRHQRHHVLRARAVQDHRPRRRRRAHVGRRHGARQHRRHLRVHRHRRQARPPQALLPGRLPDAPLPGHRRDAHRRDVRWRRRGQDSKDLRGHRGGVHLRLRRRLRLVVGPARRAGAERDLPAGDPAGGAGHQRGRQHALHLRRRAGVPPHALPPEVRPLLLLRRVGARHDALRRRLPAGDEGRAHREDGDCVESTLVLAKVRRRWHGRRC